MASAFSIPARQCELGRSEKDRGLENEIIRITGRETLRLDDAKSAAERLDRPVSVNMKVMILIGEKRHSGLRPKLSDPARETRRLQQ